VLVRDLGDELTFDVATAMATNSELPCDESQDDSKPISNLQFAVQWLLWMAFGMIAPVSILTMTVIIASGHHHSEADLFGGMLQCFLVPIVLTTGTFLCVLMRSRIAKGIVLMILAIVLFLTGLMLWFYDIS